MYLIRLPGMERVWHLHPEMTGPGNFTQNLPALSAGRYQIYADIVHGSGLPETLAAQIQIDLPGTAGHPLTGDDAGGAGPPLSDMELYMGMQGHAAFVKSDGSVFAHIHPSGTVPMAALALTENDPHAGHAMRSSSLPATVSLMRFRSRGHIG